jgi:hypothetical protein
VDIIIATLDKALTKMMCASAIGSESGTYKREIAVYRNRLTPLSLFASGALFVKASAAF